MDSSTLVQRVFLYLIKTIEIMNINKQDKLFFSALTIIQSIIMIWFILTTVSYALEENWVPFSIFLTLSIILNKFINYSVSKLL